jgi:hypothetical protein
MILFDGIVVHVAGEEGDQSGCRDYLGGMTNTNFPL